MNWRLLVWVVSLLVLITVGVASADAKPATRIADELASVAAQHATATSAGVVFRSSDPFLPASDDWVTIDAVAAGDPDSLAADLTGLGAQHVAVAGRVVSARLPIRVIPQLETLATLRFAQPAYSATNAGLVTSQGDHAMRADAARATFGVTGAGVKVGVLSDSFNCRGGAATDVASGDLSPVTVLQEDPGCSSGTDEGRAMLQIVHDVAPGAGLAFATAQGGQANFAANIQALTAAGARVIVDDVIYFAEPMFQDGVIAQKVDAVVAQGVAYFSSAGNNARQAYDHAFAAGGSFAAGAFGPSFRGGTAHDFGGSDVFQRVTVPPGRSVRLVLQWDSPSFSAGGTGTPNDVDVYILNAAATQVLSSATTNNIASGDPVEVVSIVNSGSTALNVNIMIVKFAGPDPGRIRYVLFGGSGLVFQQFATNSGTIYGHANAKGAVAVGAAFYRQTPAYGVNPPLLEAFSSGGTTPILFDTAGARLGTPDPRADKPQIVAPDGADTTFFGTDVDGTGFPNFFGTSAAAPHAAAVGALIFQAAQTATPAQMLTALQSTALDMGPAGFDNDSGSGLIQADAALMSLATVAGITPNPVDVANAPASFMITGETFGNRGFGLPVVNFMRNGVALGQARASAIGGSTSLTVPFPTDATSLIGPLPGLSEGAVLVQVYNQTGPSAYALVGSTPLTVNDNSPCKPVPCVKDIAPNPIDLKDSPAPFTITGGGFTNGSGLPVVNFLRNGVVLGQARASAMSGTTSLTVPFPTNATSLIGPLPGLSEGAVLVQVYNQTGPSYAFVGQTSFTVNDTRPPAQVTSITLNPIDLANPPTTFTLAGQRFAEGFGLPVVNFLRNGVLLGQARASAIGGSTSLTVPFPTNATSLVGPLPGLSKGAVDVEVYNQTGPSAYTRVGSTPLTLTVNDSSPCTPPPCVALITPNPIDLKDSPAPFTITGGGFTNGSGLPVVNFLRNGVVLGQARASAMSGTTSLTVPFPTNATSLIGPLPGLSEGAVLVQVYNQTGPSYAFVGQTSLTVNDTRPPAQVTSITLNPIDLANPPTTFTLAGQRFAEGFGLPVVNFLRNGVLLGQARASAIGGSTSLTVPFPTNATSLVGPLPGLSEGAVLVQVYNQTGPSAYALVGSTPLTVNDNSPCKPVPCVKDIAPNPIDLKDSPAPFTITGGGFTNASGLPVVNFLRNGVVLGQAQASAMSGTTSLTVPFPTNATSLIGPLPGLSEGAVLVQVYNKTGPSYAFVGQTSLTVNDTRPPAQVTSITLNPIDLANPPTTFTLAGQRFAEGFGLPVVNFLRNGVLLGQARASAIGGSTSLTVPFPTNATSLVGPLPGLSKGAVDVEVYNQTGPSAYTRVGSTPLTLTVNDTRPAQVALFNNLIFSSGQPFTARLTASEGYTWFAFSGTASPYQPVSTPTLSNFEGEAVGFPGATFRFAGSFNILPATRYVLVLTVNSTGGLVLGLINQGALTLSAEAPQELGAPDAALAGQPGGDPTIQFAPAGAAPNRR